MHCKLVLQQLMSVCIEIESEGWRVPQGAEGAEHAGGGSRTVCGGCTIWIWPPDPEVSATGEPSFLYTALLQQSLRLCQSCCSLITCWPGGVVRKVFSGWLQRRPLCGDLQRTASVERCPSEQRGAATDLSSVSLPMCCQCPFGVQLGFPSVPAQIHSLHLHFRFKHLTLPVLIDR